MRSRLRRHKASRVPRNHPAVQARYALEEQLAFA
jgi:hypothetical protein